MRSSRVNISKMYELRLLKRALNLPLVSALNGSFSVSWWLQCGCWVWLWSVDVECGCGVWMLSVVAVWMLGVVVECGC